MLHRTVVLILIGACAGAPTPSPVRLPDGLEIQGDKIELGAYPERTPTTSVATQEELNQAIPRLKAGDIVEVADGTFDGFRVALPATVEGTPDRKIVIRARSPFGVVLTGASSFQVQGRHIQIEGFRFKGAREDAVVLGGSSNRLSRCQFLDCGHPKKTQSQVVILPPGAQNSEVDYNEFVGSLSMSIKVRADAEDSPAGTKDNYLHHNTFRDIKRLSQNGQEPIQLAGPGGGGTHQVMNTRVEHNLFLRANGDREAISVKAPWSFIRWNVLKDMDAAITLRGGSDCVLEGNVHINTRALRVCGSRHRIVNNVFLGASIFISHGSPGYGPARDNLIAHNTILGTRSAIQIGAQTQPVEKPAENNQIVNNIMAVQVKRTPILLDEAARAATNRFERNLLWADGSEVELPAAPAGSENLKGDPQIATDPMDYMPVPAATSPALKQGLPGLVPRNIRGRSRSEANIGAY